MHNNLPVAVCAPEILMELNFCIAISGNLQIAQNNSIHDIARFLSVNWDEFHVTPVHLRKENKVSKWIQFLYQNSSLKALECTKGYQM